MSVLNRLKKIRENEGLRKSEFERVIGKSSGYIGILEKKNGVPGGDVLISVSKSFPKYNSNWLLTGNGEMLINEKGVNEPNITYQTKKDTSKQIADLSYAMNRRLDDLEDLIYLAINKIDRSKTVEELKKELHKLQEEKVEK